MTASSEDGFSALHPALALIDDVLRAPNGVWWKVVDSKDGEVTTDAGVHLASMGVSPGLDSHAEAGHALPVPGCAGWRRVHWRLVEAARELRQAEAAWEAAWADAQAQQAIFAASFMGGEYVRE